MNDQQDESAVSDLEDEYTLLGELGRGGSAIVYRGRDHVLNRDVAIKVVRPKFAANADDAIARLTREARTVARLQHPSIVTVHAVKRLRDGGLALVMQLVPGRTLKQAVQDDGPFDPARAELVLRDVAAALAFAHAHGVVHRDVKPENIFLEAGTGRALLSDFGIAHSSEYDSRLTMTGAAIGTPAYMAPEQIDGAAANARSDLYSLGLVAWEMLTGERPWEGEALYNVIFKQKNEQLPAIDSLRPGEVPPRLQYIVERLLQKKPTARWAGADGLMAALNNWVVPSDWRQWEESHRRRREAERSRPRPKTMARDDDADATVRFARPADGIAPAVLAERNPVKAQASSPAGAPEQPQDEAPSWADNPAPRSRRWLLSAVALLAVTVAGGAFAMYATRAGLLDSRPPVVASIADARNVELPVVAPIASVADTAIDDTARVDSTGNDVTASRAESETKRDSLAGALHADSVRTDSTTSVASAPASPVSPAKAAIRATDDVTTAGAGGRHSCTLIGGKGYCWGGNDRGQLGDGDVEPHDRPMPIIGDLEFTQLTTGFSHSCGIVRGGDAYCWGADDRGQLGDATTTSRSAPVRVAGNQSYRVLRAGQFHTCGLTTAGDVYCWGANANGQLGDGGTTTRSSPVRVAADVRFVSISAGWSHSCAIAVDGVAYCWGANAAGQIGNGSRADVRTPLPVHAPAGSPVSFTAIAAGNTHSCAISESGEAYCWGRNGFGQLGTGGASDRDVPTRVETAVRFASVTVAGVHTCARTRAGQVWCWGRNVYGQLGDGTTTNRDVPTRVIASATFTSINATGAHTCAMSSDGETSCWGFNVEGQLGDGSRNHHPRPTRVILPGR